VGLSDRFAENRVEVVDVGSVGGELDPDGVPVGAGSEVCTDDASFDPVAVELDEGDDEESSAHATPGVVATAPPTPSAIASAPTRPTHLA